MLYSVFRTKDFERSYERCKRSGQVNFRAKAELEQIIDELAAGRKLAIHRRDHQLRGEFKMYRECHIKGDLLLVYQLRKVGLVLVLVDIGSHSYLGI